MANQTNRHHAAKAQHATLGELQDLVTVRTGGKLRLSTHQVRAAIKAGWIGALTVKNGRIRVRRVLLPQLVDLLIQRDAYLREVGA